ncbi:hypothetical protein NIAHE148_02190 [Escherichia coli]|nr:hypothetical protein NIAHE148_02190 [Escherichia coli]
MPTIYCTATALSCVRARRKKLRRPLNKETTALGILAGYRNLGKSVWRATYKIPDPPEKSWYSRFMPKKKVELDAGIEQSAIVIKERDD